MAHFLIDYGYEHDLHWVCFQNDTSECWTWNNSLIKLQNNITAGRINIPKEIRDVDIQR